MARRGARAGAAAGFATGFVAELTAMPRRPAMMGLIVVLPLALFVVMASIFRAGMPNDLPVALIDQDGSQMSRSLARMLDATPEIALATTAPDLAQATGDIRSGAVRGAVLIPPDFGRDVMRGARPEVVVFYDNQHMSPGAIISRGARNAVGTLAGGVRLHVRTAQGAAPEAAMAALDPVPVQAHGLFNPGMDYVDFLLAALVPTIIQIVAAASMAYAGALWRGAAQGHGPEPLAQATGRVAAYSLVLLMVFGLADLLVYGQMGVPIRGSVWAILAGSVLFVLAAQGVGLWAWLITRDLGRAISVVALITAPAFGFMGVGFPREGMGWLARLWGDLLPGTWLVTLRFDQSLRAAPLAVSATALLVLAAMACTLAAAVIWRSARPPRARPEVAPHWPVFDTRRPLRAAFRREWAGMMRDAQVRSLLVGALVIYALIYPLPYRGEALRDVPLVVVDHDGSALSRQLTRDIDAAQETRIASAQPDMQAARATVLARDAWGIVVIPQGFARDLMRGQTSPVALYADASYFLIYQQIMRGVAVPARTLGARVEAARLIAQGTDPAVAQAQIAPIRHVDTPLFNPAGGYATYVLPAAFVLILQQTALMGLALVALRRPHVAAPRLALLAGRAGAWLALYALAVPGYLVVLPALYGLPRLGSMATVMAIALPFVLATGCLAQIVARLVGRTHLVQLVLLSLGLPFFFLSGFAWPAEAIPAWLATLAQALPSTPAIDAFVRATSMGATLPELAPLIRALWVQAGVYGLIWLAPWQRRAMTA